MLIERSPALNTRYLEAKRRPGYIQNSGNCWSDHPPLSRGVHSLYEDSGIKHYCSMASRCRDSRCSIRAVRGIGQTSLTWQQIKQKFEAANPTLKAAQLTIDESRAAEITAYLRPNPDLSLSTDGTQISRFNGSGGRSPALKSLPPSVICTNARTKGSCVATRRRSPPP